MFDFNFPGQREGEDVLAVIYKHPIVYTRIIAGFFILIILPITVFCKIWFYFYPLASFYEKGVIVGIFASLVFLYGLLFACIAWINEEFDLFILTTERLMDITQVNFFKRTIASTPLEQIQDTTGVVSGILATIFHYGNLTVQTAAGNASEFFIDKIPDPEGAARNILDWADKKRLKTKKGLKFTRRDAMGHTEASPDDE